MGKDSQKEIREAQEKVINRDKKKKEEKVSKEEKKEKIKLEDLDFELPRREKPSAPPKVLEDLEAALSKDKIPKQILESQYTQELSREPVEVIYDKINQLKESVQEKGYLNLQEQKQVQYMVGAIEQKLEDQEAGTYSFTESVARKASLIHKIGSDLRDMYKSGSSKKSNSLYRVQ
ncbi:MAG TPA: hypothetical protein VJI98_00390 [Candidatus Nanoarchaeia archaeon]|nr:hypothetical protein [Candidatus Nanoarchaeia archaeon]